MTTTTLTDRQLPAADSVDDAQLAEAIRVYRERRDEAAEAERTATQLEQERPLAEAADRDAYAEALKAGKPDPGAKKTAEADKAIVAARRRADALAQLVDDAYRDLAAAVKATRERGELDERIAAARDRFGKVLDELQDAHGELALSTALRSWLNRFGEARAQWSPDSFGGVVPSPRTSEPMVSARVLLTALRPVADSDAAGPPRDPRDQRTWRQEPEPDHRLTPGPRAAA